MLKGESIFKEKDIQSNPEFICLEEKPVPFINALLELLGDKNIFFSEEDLYHYFKNSTNLEFSYLMSLANRQAGDITGILGHLIGFSHGPEHTEKIVRRIGEQALAKLEGSPNKNKIINLLNNQQDSQINLDAFNTIDNLAGFIIKKIKILAYESCLTNNAGEQTIEAIEFKDQNQEKLNNLINTVGEGDINNLLNRSFETDPKGNITKISQAPIIPKFDISLLSDILPDSLRYNSSKIYEADDPLGFVSKINMAGSGIYRNLIKMAGNIELARKIANY